MVSSAIIGTASANIPTTTATPTTERVGSEKELVVGTRTSNGEEVVMSS